MLETISRIAISAFRGVPDSLDVDLPDGRSLLIYGDNGTGKSTIADAIEWYFTGQIEFLAHEGRGHALRHLGAEESIPTEVTLATSGSLGGSASLSDSRSIVAEEGLQDTFLLRGRTLADFINKTKGEKWAALSTILGLEEFDRLGKDLKRAANDLRRDATEAKKQADATGARVREIAPGADESTLLNNISELCIQADVPRPDCIETATSVDWIRGVAPQKIFEKGRLEALKHSLESTRLLQIDPKLWNERVAGTDDNAGGRHEFLSSGLAALKAESETGHCPLCQQPVEVDRLRISLESQIDDIREDAEDLENAKQSILSSIADLERQSTRREETYRGLRSLGIALDEPPVHDTTGARGMVTSVCRVPADLFERTAERATQWDETALSRIQEALAATSPSSLSDLVLLCERAKTWRDEIANAECLDYSANLAAKCSSEYQQRFKAEFNRVLASISCRAAELYSLLHPGEALEDVGVETWKTKGIELAITFHGSRQKPPHGVLSESHLNSLAIALFLAMAETFNSRMGFLVLDDVVNSFDSEHRGALAHVLAEEFGQWQLLVFTHDRLFYERIKRLAPQWSSLELTSWTFEDGPRTTHHDGPSSLAKAFANLEQGDRMGAAMKGRRALEEILQEACEALEAPLPFRRGLRNDRREIGGLMKGLRSCLKSRAKKYYQVVEKHLTTLEADVQAAFNPESHSSQTPVSAAEVRSALEHVATLNMGWTCSSCSTRIWHKGSVMAAMCRCGRSTFPPTPNGADPAKAT